MRRNQNETKRIRISDCGMRNVRSTSGYNSAINNSAIRNPQSAFTLVELLVVITIIAILAGLITGAALNALNKSKQVAITLELQQIGTAVENFKNELGNYPPNAITPSGVATNSTAMITVRSDLERAIRKAFPRHDESDVLINKLIGDPSTTGSLGATGTGSGTRPSGLTGAEAAVLWLGGLSKDTTLPFSGPGGPSFFDNNNDGAVDPSLEVLENRNWGDGFEFDLGRLGPRDANGQFNGRFIVYTANGVDHRINLWTYTPPGSLQPLVYFDTSNITPEKRFLTTTYNYELRSSANPNDPNAPIIFPIRQPLETVTITNPGVAQTKYVNQGKFQLLHCGTDDIWGDFSPLSSTTGVNTTSAMAADNTPLATLYPIGPFIGDIADTVGNFMTGNLGDEQE